MFISKMQYLRQVSWFSSLCICRDSSIRRQQNRVTEAYTLLYFWGDIGFVWLLIFVVLGTLVTACGILPVTRKTRLWSCPSVTLERRRVRRSFDSPSESQAGCVHASQPFRFKAFAPTRRMSSDILFILRVFLPIMQYCGTKHKFCLVSLVPAVNPDVVRGLSVIVFLIEFLEIEATQNCTSVLTLK
jgi:hypothetical protein